MYELITMHVISVHSEVCMDSALFLDFLLVLIQFELPYWYSTKTHRWFYQ